MPGTSSLPAAVRLPHHIWNTDGSVWPGQAAGFLGSANDPWLFRCEPASESFKIPEFSLPEQLSFDRFAQRRELLDQVDRHVTDARLRSDALGQYDGATEQAFDLLTAP